MAIAYSKDTGKAKLCVECEYSPCAQGSDLCEDCEEWIVRNFSHTHDEEKKENSVIW